MKVVSLETGEPLAAGEEGELCFSGPNVRDQDQLIYFSKV